MSSKRSSGVSEAATMVDAKRKGNLVVMTKGGTKKSNTYYFALGESALYYFTSDAAEKPKGEYKLSAFSNCAVLDEKKCIFELASPIKSIYFKVDSKESLGSWVTLINEAIQAGRSTANLLARQGRVEYNAYLKAKGVADGAQDMFVTVAGNGVEMSRSEVIWQTATPRWYHECDLGFERSIESVLISVYDIRKKGNVHIGHVLLTPDHLKNDLEQPEWFPIEKRIDDITMSIEISKTPSGEFHVKVVSASGLVTAKGLSWAVEIKADGKAVATTTASADGSWGSTHNIPAKTQAITLLLQTNGGEQVGKVEINTSNDECCGSNEWEVSGPTVGQLRLTWKSSTSIVLADEKYDPLFALMVDNEMEVVKMISICKGVEQTGTMSKHFTLAFEMRRTAAHFIKALVEDEIARTTQPATIFRGNSLATKSLDYFMKMTAMPALHHILKPIIAEIYKGKRPCELDARRLEEPKDAEKKIKKNVENVIYYCNQILNACLMIPKILPLTLRNIFCEMRKHLTKQWPDHPTVKYSGPSGFIFLRFICPAILGPTIFGLSNDHASCSVARDLMLVAKSVQNLANLRIFGEKEPFMCPMNDFIEKNLDVMKGLLDEISTPPTSPIDEIPKTHLNINFGKEMAQVASFFSHNYSALVEAYGDDNHALVKLKTVLEMMDEEKKNIVDPSGLSAKKVDTFKVSTGTPPNSSSSPTAGTRGKRRSIILTGSKKPRKPEDEGPESDTSEKKEEADVASLQNRVKELEEENSRLKERVAALEKINAELSGKR